MALTQERDTQRRQGFKASFLMDAVKILAGGIVCIDTGTGYATPGDTSTTLVAVGVATQTVDNSAGAAGDERIEVDREGWFRFDNSGEGDEITAADIGSVAYLVDDATVAKTAATASRSAAGRIRDVDADGVWIEFLQ